MVMSLRGSHRALLLLVVLILALTACGASDGGDGDAAREDPAAVAPETPPAGHDVPGDDEPGDPDAAGGDGEAAGGPAGDAADLFDVEQIQVGDVVAGMRVEAVSAYGDPGQPPDTEFPSVTVGFSGQVTLTGSFEYFPPDDEFFPEVVCFFPDETSAGRLPVMAGDGRNVWFCFDNVDEARRVFGGQPGTGTATVTIDAYTIHRYPSEVVNTAVLLEAVDIRR